MLQFVVIARVLLTWINPGQAGSNARWFTEPVDKVLKPLRILIPVGQAYLDLGPLLALLILSGIQRVIVHLPV